MSGKRKHGKEEEETEMKGIRGRGSDEKTRGRGRQMVAFNYGDGEVAMS